MKKLPAGLEDNTLEIYRHDGKVRAVMSGNRCDYLALHPMLREPFQAELIADKKASDFIGTEWKISDPDLMEEKFVGCRYGAFNSMPDLDGHKTSPDAPCCEMMFICKGLGFICLIPDCINGKLSAQEFLVSVLVSRGRLDKEIALQLKIEISTVRTYLNRIREKLCVNNRIEIAQWAYQQGII